MKCEKGYFMTSKDRNFCNYHPAGTRVNVKPFFFKLIRKCPIVKMDYNYGERERERERERQTDRQTEREREFFYWLYDAFAFVLHKLH